MGYNWQSLKDLEEFTPHSDAGTMDTAPPSNSILARMTETDVANDYEWASLDNEE